MRPVARERVERRARLPVGRPDRALAFDLEYVEDDVPEPDRRLAVQKSWRRLSLGVSYGVRMRE